MDNSYGMLALQKVNLYILQEIDRICKKYKINYTLDSGTLLGAIRHGGFIPWDDDADIAMTRSNFEAFRRIVKRELSDKLEFIMPNEFKNGKVFYDFTPRIIYKPSARHKKNDKRDPYEGKLNHLWVDIFIIDKLPKSKPLQRLILFSQKLIYLFSMGHRKKLDLKKYKGSMKIAVSVFSIIGKIISMKYLFRLQDRLSKLFYKSRKSCTLYYSNYQPDYIDIKVNKDWYEKYLNIKFEDTVLSIIDEYDSVLQLVYGDYMTPPPKADRVPTHGSMEIEVYE
ncbi:LICD family protein [Lachnoanaerobaculum saburreum F0468]|uniref:LICD family protein n=1 Tax=Lachnoanaerobaculum saburreum F0468 TaxID=1095750 RepID=I0R4G5_9FIRM|nr:LicD family protein [Lachnoanaerobaculum saburreum]EIC94573.1 LICD family protein [Lachnoanaerobaculum saburreum F0468]